MGHSASCPGTEAHVASGKYNSSGSEDFEIGGKTIRKGQATIAIMVAANRDPERFPDPDRIDIRRTDNRHLSFGWAAHFCFGAPLARIEGQVTFEVLLGRLPDLALEPGVLVWRHNLGLRGLEAMPVKFNKENRGVGSSLSDLRTCA
jgi:cytochrome P450